MSEFTYKGKEFFIDGKPMHVYSGAMHYFRIPRPLWKDRLLKLKECGFNTVETYVAWNLHEPKEGVFDFEGWNDLGAYLDLAKELGLYAIVRPGPYICAEWEAGGFPAWIYNYPVRLRCNEPVYMSKVENYFNELFKHLTPRMIKNGGNIIMLQVENEYGSYGNDKEYLQKIVEIYKKNGANCLYYTCDGALEFMMKGGSTEGVIEFLTFGSGTENNMKKLVQLFPDQPGMCTEFWCGWFDHWYEEHHVRDPKNVCSDTKPFFDGGYNFSYYMFHGGTNFGFMNGANCEHSRENIQPTVTSYDYNSPLSESGDRTPLYYALRELFIDKGIAVPELTATDSEKRAYGKVTFTKQADLFENLTNINKPVHSSYPLYMEELGQSYGYINYSTVVQNCHDPEAFIEIEELADRAILFVDGKKLGVLERGRKENPQLKIDFGDKDSVRLDVLIENMGRINYGKYMFDKKGMKNLYAYWAQHQFGYEITSLPMDDFSKIKFAEIGKEVSENPTFYKGTFTVDKVCDTFIKPEGFTKGFILINGFNIGRYYNPAGPQKTLYVPACLLSEGENEIIIFESDGAKELNAQFVAVPEL